MTRFYIEQKHEFAEFFSTYSDVENIDNYGDMEIIFVHKFQLLGFQSFYYLNDK